MDWLLFNGHWYGCRICSCTFICAFSKSTRQTAPSSPAGGHLHFTTTRQACWKIYYSYWTEFIYKHYLDNLQNFLKSISKSLDEKDLKILLLSREKNDVVILFLLFLTKGRGRVSLECLPGKLQNKIDDLFS